MSPGGLDEWIRLRIFQRIADAVADRGGPNCFRLAATSAEAMIATFVTTCALVWIQDRALGVAEIAVILVATPLPLALRAEALREAKRFEAALDWQPSANQLRRLEWRALRIMPISWLVAHLVGAAWTALAGGPVTEVKASVFGIAFSLAWTGYAYFMACIPRPPRRRRARAAPRTLSWLVPE